MSLTADLYLSGLTIREVAKKLGISKGTVHSQLVKLRIPRRSHGQPAFFTPDKECPMCQKIFRTTSRSRKHRFQHRQKTFCSPSCANRRMVRNQGSRGPDCKCGCGKKTVRGSTLWVKGHFLRSKVTEQQRVYLKAFDLFLLEPSMRHRALMRKALSFTDAPPNPEPDQVPRPLLTKLASLNA